MSNPIIRRALREDIPTIIRFNIAMAAETENVTLDPILVQKGVEALYENSSMGFYIVCEVEEEVRACLMISYEWSDWRNGLFWWIQSVYVESDYRKRGLYKLMYSYIKTLVDENEQIVGLRLYVDNENRSAQKVYKNLGMIKSNYQLFEYSKLEIKK